MLKTLLVLSIMTTSLPNAMATGTKARTSTTSYDPITRNVYQCSACEELLKECNDVVGKCEEAIDAQADTIDMLEMQKRVQQRELEAARSELASRRSWYKQPAFLFTAGVLTGFLISTQVGK